MQNAAVDYALGYRIFEDAQGLLAARPAPDVLNPHQGYFATDVPAYYRSDGLIWRQFILDSTSNVFTAPQTFDDDAYFESGVPWVDVTTKGAVGDGVADDTAAIQTAIDSLGATGGVVYFPGNGREYLCASGLDLSDKAHITLQGPGSATGGSQGPATIEYTGTGARFIDGAGSEGLQIKGLYLKASNPAFAGKVVVYRRSGGNVAARGCIEDCTIEIVNTGGGSGLSFSEGTGGGITTRIEHCSFVGGKWQIEGCDTANPLDTDGVRIFNCTFLGYGEAGGAIRQPNQGWSIIGNSFYPGTNTVGRGIICDIQAAFGITIHGNWFGDNNAGTWIQVRGFGWSITGNSMGSGGTLIDCIGGGGVTIDSNTFGNFFASVIAIKNVDLISGPLNIGANHYFKSDPDLIPITYSNPAAKWNPQHFIQGYGGLAATTNLDAEDVHPESVFGSEVWIRSLTRGAVASGTYPIADVSLPHGLWLFPTDYETNGGRMSAAIGAGVAPRAEINVFSSTGPGSLVLQNQKLGILLLGSDQLNDVATTSEVHIGSGASTIGFFGATPVVKHNGSQEYLAFLRDLGIIEPSVAAPNAPNLDLGDGALIAGALRLTGEQHDFDDVTFVETAAVFKIFTGITNGTKIGTLYDQKIGFWGAAPVTQPSGGELVAALKSSGIVGAGDYSAQFDGLTISDSTNIIIGQVNGTRIGDGTPNCKLSFYDAPPVPQQTCLGSRSDGSALYELLGKLHNLGLVRDGTTP